MSNKKDKKEEQLEKLEGGFSLYTNGAHQPKERYIPRHTTAKSSSSSKRSQHFVPRMHKNNPLLDLKALQDEQQQVKQRVSSGPSNVTSRKKWSNTSFTIKTTDGCEIKINAPNHYQSSNDKTNKKSDNSVHSNDCEYYYSDDFESDSDNEIRVTKSDSKNLIESVRFSDQSDREDSSSDDNEPKPQPDRSRNKKNQMVLRLSQNDVKVKVVRTVIIISNQINNCVFYSSF